MHLDRNITSDGLGKYAILKLRKLRKSMTPEIYEAIKRLEDAGILDWGLAGTEAEFMLIRLKDQYALPALSAYAVAASEDDPEYAAEIVEMARRSGVNSQWCKKPD